MNYTLKVWEIHNLTLFPCWIGNSQLIYVNKYTSCLSPSISLFYILFQQYFYIWQEFWYTLVYLILAWANDRLCKNNFRILLFLPVLPAPTFILLNVLAFWSCKLCLWVVHKFVIFWHVVSFNSPNKGIGLFRVQVDKNSDAFSCIGVKLLMLMSQLHWRLCGKIDSGFEFFLIWL